MDYKDIAIIVLLIVISFLSCIVCYFFKRSKAERICSEKYKEVVDKDELIILTLLQWVQIEHEKKKIETILYEMRCKNVAIYGYGHLGRLLAKNLQGTELNLACIIDKNKNLPCEEFKLYSPYDELPQVEAIIVTSVYFFDEIKAELRDLLPDVEILSLYDILYQL